MEHRFDYARALDIFLNYEKVDGKHLIRQSDFMKDFYLILSGNSEINAENTLEEMYSLDLIQNVFADHKLGEEGVLLLDKGYELLKKHRNMEVNSDVLTELNELKQRISSTDSKGQKEAYLITLSEIINAYRADCRTAAIALCGKILEIYFYELLKNSRFVDELYRIDNKTKEKIPRNDIPLWKLRSLSSQLPNINSRQLPNNEVINTITAFRNASVHFSESNYNPKKGVVDGVIHFLIVILDPYFSKARI